MIVEKFAGYLLHEKIHETSNSVLYRGQKENEPLTHVVKILKTKYPTPTEVARFMQEYNLVKNLDIAGIVKIYDLVEDHNRYAIIEEDFEGISLKQLIRSNSIDIKSFLRIAKEVSETINEIFKPIVATKGFFIAGKFEQFMRDVPYSSIIQALFVCCNCYKTSKHALEIRQCRNVLSWLACGRPDYWFESRLLLRRLSFWKSCVGTK